MKTHTLLRLLLAFILSAGCWGCDTTWLGGFQPDAVCKNPDSPMFIMDAKDDYLLVAIYDKASNKLVEYGWIPTSEIKNWTVLKYNWEKFINDHASK